MSGKTILILGGGIGGQVAANVLRKSLNRDHRVILVDRRREFVFSPSLLWVMVGQRRVDQISRPLDLLSKKGIGVFQAEVTRIDPGKKTVVAGEQTLSYNYLIISLGADLARESIPGLKEEAHIFYEPSGAQSLLEAARSFSGGRVV